MRRQDGMTAAIDESKDVILRNLAAKTNAARTKNAPLVVELHARPELNIFRFFNFVFQKARAGGTVLDAEFLELTFARLIADRTIEWMVNEQKFHHALAAFLDHWRIR